MSGPFRSEVEQLRENLRRAEEKAELLAEENRDLERELDLRGRSRYLPLAVASGLALSVLIGSGAHLLTKSSAAAKSEAASAAHRAQLGDEIAKHQECKVRYEASQLDVASCLQSLADERLEALRAVSRTPQCQPGDPLCSWQQADPTPNTSHAGFDLDGASLALNSAAPSIGECLSPRRGTSFHAKLTFVPSGQVVAAEVEQDETSPVPHGLTSKEETCVMQLLRRIKVRPSSDVGPIRVGKRFVITP